MKRLLAKKYKQHNKWKLYFFYNNLSSSFNIKGTCQYLDPLYTGSTSRTHFHGGFYQNIFQFHGSSVKQQSAIICLLADRRPWWFRSALLSCVQLLTAFNCFVMRFHQTPLAAAPWHRKWHAQHLPLSTFWLLLLKSCPCSLQKLFTSILKVSIASCVYGFVVYPSYLSCSLPPFFTMES